MERISHNPLLTFYAFTKRAWPQAVISLVAVVCGSSLNIYQLVVIKQFTNAIVDHQPSALVWQLGLLYPVIHLLHTLSWRVSGFAGMRWFHNVRESMYARLYDDVIRHDKSYFSDRFAGSLLSKINNVVEGTQNMFQRILWEFVPILLNAVFTLYVAYFENWVFSAVLLAWLVIYFFANLIIVKKYLAPTAYDSALSRSNLSGRTVDSLSNAASIHVFAAWNHELAFVRESIRKVKEAGLKNWTVSENLRGFNGIMMVLSNLIMIGLSLHFFYGGKISIGSVLFIIGLGKNLGDLMWNFSSELRNTVTDYGSAREGLDEILQPFGITSKAHAKKLHVTDGEIVLEHISFAYETEEVLKDLSLPFHKGQRVGLVGKSGAGKSTLVSLLLRNHDPQNGTITIDGENISNINLMSLRQAISYVPQDINLFHRSLLENIRYAKPDATKEEVIAAAKAAHAHVFITSLEEGYDTLVGERGVKLSGGQRQRIAIARAFLKNAPILILDEATSSLDSESEVAIQKSLERLMKGKTMIAIAHRLSTLREMDRIIVIEKGHIVEDGTPVALLKKKHGIFKTLWDHQISGFIPEED